jgi:hypothetical protein
MLQASAAPFHSDLQQQRYTKLQKLIKKADVISDAMPAMIEALRARNRTGVSVCLDDVSHQPQPAPFVKAK